MVLAISCAAEPVSVTSGSSGSTSEGSETSSPDGETVSPGDDTGPGVDECRSSEECREGACVRVECGSGPSPACGYFVCQDACTPQAFDRPNGVECLDDAGCCYGFCSGLSCWHGDDEDEDDDDDSTTDATTTSGPSTTGETTSTSDASTSES